MYEIKGTRKYVECGRIITIECKINDIPNEDDNNEYKDKDLLVEFICNLQIINGVILYNNEVIAEIKEGEVIYLE